MANVKIKRAKWRLCVFQARASKISPNAKKKINHPPPSSTHTSGPFALFLYPVISQLLFLDIEVMWPYHLDQASSIRVPSEDARSCLSCTHWWSGLLLDFWWIFCLYHFKYTCDKNYRPFVSLPVHKLTRSAGDQIISLLY